MSEGSLPITVFADFTSPFCYLTEAGLARLARRHRLDLRYRSFELFPSPSPIPLDGHDATDPGRTSPLAAEVGIALTFPDFIPRTRKAHEAARFAAQHGQGEEMRAALYAAYWSEGRDIGRIDVLMEIAASLDMDPTDLKIALDIDRFRDEIVSDEELARHLRVTRVPTIFVGTGPTARILEGARELAALDEALMSG